MDWWAGLHSNYYLVGGRIFTDPDEAHAWSEHLRRCSDMRRAYRRRLLARRRR